MKDHIITTAAVLLARTRRTSRVALLPLAVAAGTVIGCGERVDGLPPVTLLGERAGALVWNAVPDATNYRMDIMDSAGKVRIAHAAPDTFATLPVGFSVTRGDQWWVRAYNGKKIIAASERARMY